jgi:transcriptional regulator with XRE-family HTH domain
VATTPSRDAGSSPLAVALGARVRTEREAAGVSLRGLARRLDVSPSLLSQIERGLAKPSVGTLWAIVTELGLSLDSMFSDVAAQPDEAAPVAATGDGAAGPHAPDPLVQRADRRQAIALAEGVRWERLTPAPDADVGFALVTYEPGASSGAAGPPAEHTGREYGLVLSGGLAIEVDGRVRELAAGDAIRFSSETPHRLWSIGDQPAVAVWFNLSRAA